MYILEIEMTVGGYGRGFHAVCEAEPPFNPKKFETEEAAQAFAETFYPEKNRKIKLDKPQKIQFIVPHQA